MNKLIYALILIVSRLPFFILYKLASFIYVLLYYVLGYRKEVVYKNLRNSFPNKSKKEIKQIAKKFYRNFSDYFVESIKLLTAETELIKEKFAVEGIDLVNKCVEQKKNVAVITGHVFNFELSIVYNNSFDQEKIYTVYKKSKNKFWNEKLKELRSQFGNIGYESNKIKATVKQMTKDGNNLIVLVSDQSPKPIQSDLFIDFLNQKTLVYKGFEKIVRENNFIPFYGDITKEKQGKYSTRLIEIKPDGEKFEENELIYKFFDLLEKSIIKDPSNWLWTHNRWKTKPKNS